MHTLERHRDEQGRSNDRDKRKNIHNCLVPKTKATALRPILFARTRRYIPSHP